MDSPGLVHRRLLLVRAAVLGAVLVCAGLADPATVAADVRPARGPSADGDALRERIGRFRCRGLYAEALPLARRLQDSLAAAPRTKAWKKEDAARLSETLRLAARLSPADRESLALADRSDGAIRQCITDGRYLQGLRLARAQFATRRRILGTEHQETARSLKWIADLQEHRLQHDLVPDLQAEVLALRRRVLGGKHPEVAESLHDYGLACKNRNTQELRHDRGTARESYQQALALRRELLEPNDPAIFSSMFSIADLARSGRDFQRAIEGLQEVLALRQRWLGPEHPESVFTMAMLAYVLLMENRTAEAYPLAAEAAVLSRRAPGLKKIDRSFILSIAGDAEFYAGHYPQAERWFTENTRILEFLRTQGVDDPQKNNHSLGNYQSLAAVQLLQGKDEVAWGSMQRAGGRRILDALIPPDTSGARFAQGAGVVPDRRFLPLARIQAALPESAAVVGWNISYIGGHRCDGPFWGYVIRKAGPVRWVRLHAIDAPEGSDLRSHMIAYNTQIDNAAIWPGRVTDLSAIDRISRTLYEEGFKPLEPHLAGIRTLVVEQSSMKTHIPLESVLDSSATPVGDRFEVFYVPSATLFAWMRERASTPREPRAWKALLIGDPALGALEMTSSGESAGARPPRRPARDPALWSNARLLRGTLEGEADARMRLPPLPMAGRELAQAAARFPGATVLSGHDASLGRIRRLAAIGELARFDLIHLATHALWGGSFVLSPPDPASGSTGVRARPGTAWGRLPEPVDRSDALLLGREISSWRLNADLVSLSACRTAGTATAVEIAGAGAFFLMAGARCVLESLWNAEDESAALLLGRFYENLTGSYAGERAGRRALPMTKPAALQEAKRWLRSYQAPEGTRPFQHPAYWAKFVLLGDPLD